MVAIIAFGPSTPCGEQCRQVACSGRNDGTEIRFRDHRLPVETA